MKLRVLPQQQIKKKTTHRTNSYINSLVLVVKPKHFSIALTTSTKPINIFSETGSLSQIITKVLTLSVFAETESALDERGR